MDNAKKPPEILVNGRFTLSSLTGVQRYAGEVSRQLENKTILLIPRKAANGISGHLWEQMSLPKLVRQDDLLWSPANSGPLRVANQVVTIHDVSPLDHPEWFESLFGGWYRFLIPRLARRVRKVITVSEFSKQRIVQICKIPDEKVTVIPGGVNKKFQPATEAEITKLRRQYSLSKPYVLAVGSLQPRKNLAGLFQAWQLLRRKYPGVELVAAGAGGRMFRGKGFDEAPEGVRLVGYIPEEDLAGIYSGALALVFPSLYEGFGLPILEAMACGTPVLASNATAVPEVLGEAGILFDPNEPEAMARAMSKALDDQGLRRDLREKGLRRAQDFTWEVTAQRTYEALRQSLEAGL